MTPRRAGLALVSALVVVASCGGVILDRPVRLSDGGWTITIEKVEDGPDFWCHPGWNLFVFSGACSSPGGGDRFVWATVRVTNEGAAPRRFNFERCDLDDGARRILPGAVDLDSAFVNWKAEEEPELGAGETISRRVIFAYPRASRATRLSCYPNVVPLPRFEILQR
jgi:hypothetical protein